MNNSTNKQQNTPADKAKRAAYGKQWRLNNKQYHKLYMKRYVLNNKAKLAAYNKQYNFDNKTHQQEYMQRYSLDNKPQRQEYIQQYNKQYYKQEHIKHHRRQYYKQRQEYIQQYNKQYYKQEHIKHHRRQYYKQRYQTDLLYKIKRSLRTSVSSAFRRIGQNKPARTEQLLGCSWLEAKAHFERLFQEGMRWDNHGEWHIDHIRPVASFKPDELHLMNHISNLQPLWAEENLGSKKVSDMVKWLHIQKHL